MYSLLPLMSDDRKPRTSQYYAGWVAVMAAITLGVELTSNAFIASAPGQVPSLLAACLPLIPGVGAIAAFLGWVRRLDEMQHRIHLEAVGFAFVTTALSVMFIGSLEQAGLPDIGWAMLWPVMGVAWLTGLALAHWRYR